MRYDIILAPTAIDDLNALPAHERTKVKQALELYLRHEPTKTSKSRIKRLKGLAQPQYRLRMDEIRVYYDVSDTDVEVLAILHKSETAPWLAAEGIPDEEQQEDETSGTLGSEG